MKAKRTFTPTQESQVQKWVWTKGKGLQVYYKDGQGPTNSWWGSLSEFLKAVKEGREVKVVES